MLRLGFRVSTKAQTSQLLTKAESYNTGPGSLSRRISEEVTEMKKASFVILTAALLVFGICDTAQSQKTSEQKPPNLTNQPEPAFRRIAIGRQRISRGKQTIAISRGGQNVVANYFAELVIAKIVDDFSLGARKADPKSLNGLTVSLARDVKFPDLWNIFPGAASDGEALILTENVFRIQQVAASTEKDQVRFEINGRIYRLEPGEVLLLLG
jgi:hypothetical protein